jgi:hypothetical protein
MSIELPTLLLGLAGFSASQEESLRAALERSSSGTWQPGKFADADGWWVNGARVQVLPDTTVRIAPGVPGSRSLHLDLHDVDRPIAFSLPLATRQLEPLFTFDADSPGSVAAILEKFEGWLKPLMAQFCLASRILEQETVLGTGVHHVSVNGRLIAVVDMRGEIGVLPTAGPLDFDDAIWHRLPEAAAIPDHFVRISLSQLMWQFAQRTARDVLPKRYREGTLYFRRPPRLPQRLLSDSHLLLLRELAGAPGDFVDLQQRTGLGAEAMARDLAALYFVGAITSNPKRAAPAAAPRGTDSQLLPSQQHSVPSGLGAEAVAQPPVKRTPFISDMTAPAPIGPR